MDGTRRELLQMAGRGLAALGTGGVVAGCLDFAAGDGPQGPEGTPETLSCVDEAFVRLDPAIDGPVTERSVDTPTTTLELSAEGTSETYGSTLRLALRNLGDDDATTLGRHAYAVQRETGTGWVDVRGSMTGEPATLPVAEETFAPNDDYTWSLTLREDALVDAVPGTDLAVCPALGVGTHRFVYWGIEGASPVGVEFELIG